MKLYSLFAWVLIGLCFFGCSQMPGIRDADNRSPEQIQFLNKAAEEADFRYTTNAVEKDAHIKAFNKYALDSLKNVKNWEFIVERINDNPYAANTFANNFFDLDIPVYNLVLVAPIKIDNSVDTIAHRNKVTFIYTIPKQPKSDSLKKILSDILPLKYGDAVTVSGSVTYFDDKGQVNFAPLYEKSYSWHVDLLIADIKKKQAQKQ